MKYTKLKIFRVIIHNDMTKTLKKQKYKTTTY